MGKKLRIYCQKKLREFCKLNGHTVQYYEEHDPDFVAKKFNYYRGLYKIRHQEKTNA